MLPAMLIFGIAVATFVGTIMMWSYKIDSVRLDSLRSYLVIGLLLITLSEVCTTQYRFT